MRRFVVPSLFALFTLGGLALVVACSDSTIPAPASDKNFDDPDEPATPGQVGAVDAGTADTAAPSCSSDLDCPPKARRCLFAIQDGCGAVGTCVNYVEETNCQKSRFCNCAGGGVTACAPNGLSPVRVQPNTTCEEPDAASDAASDSPSDASHDAADGGG